MSDPYNLYEPDGYRVDEIKIDIEREDTDEY